MEINFKSEISLWTKMNVIRWACAVGGLILAGSVAILVMSQMPRELDLGLGLGIIVAMAGQYGIWVMLGLIHVVILGACFWGLTIWRWRFWCRAIEKDNDMQRQLKFEAGEKRIDEGRGME